MTKLDFYWKSNKDWYHRNPVTMRCVINDDAPEEAKKSYQNYLKEVKEATEKGTL